MLKVYKNLYLSKEVKDIMLLIEIYFHNKIMKFVFYILFKLKFDLIILKSLNALPFNNQSTTIKQLVVMFFMVV